MEIKPGKYYKTRHGRRVLVVEHPIRNEKYSVVGFTDDISLTALTWTKEGKSYDDHEERNLDLVSEWTDYEAKVRLKILPNSNYVFEEFVDDEWFIIDFTYSSSEFRARELLAIALTHESRLNGSYLAQIPETYSAVKPAIEGQL